jgi:type II secretory pathway predicted ATPase ExeA
MYHAHFGLEHGLFDEGIAADGAVFRAPKHDRLVAHFKLGLASPSSSIVLWGPAGVGKTTLTSMALRAISTRLALAWVGGMATNSTELLELILVELGISTLRTTRMERLQLWRQFQGEMCATDSRLFVVVERTEDLSTEVLHALDQLTAPDAVGNPGANLVLLGHAGIHDHLAAPLLDSLRQRIRLRAELEPFTEAELQDYLRHQVTCAGGQYERIFAPGAVASLHRYSQGVARLVNTLCESALDIAAVQQQKQLTPELVAKTAVTLLGLAASASAPQPAPAARPAPAAAAARASAPPIEARPPPATAPIFERRAQPRVPAAPSAPPTPPPAARAAASQPQAATAAANGAQAAAPLEIEFDGGVTDVADIAVADFPVLTDAVEAPPANAVEPPPGKPAEPPAAAKPPTAPLAKAPTAPQTSAPPAKPPAVPAAATAAARPAPKPASRVEPVTAATPASPASAKAPPLPSASPTTATPLPHVAAAKAAAAGAGPSRHREAEDALRQTQTMRAIAEAKSLDDISEIDAETLFGDAELDLVSAALASAAEWPDDEDPTAKPTPALGDTTGTKAVVPGEDALDLFGLDADAPLELIDDATLPPASPTRKTAAR